MLMPCLGNFQRQEKDAQGFDPELLEEKVTRILMAHLVYQCMHGYMKAKSGKQNLHCDTQEYCAKFSDEVQNGVN